MTSSQSQPDPEVKKDVKKENESMAESSSHGNVEKFIGLCGSMLTVKSEEVELETLALLTEMAPICLPIIQTTNENKRLVSAVATIDWRSRSLRVIQYHSKLLLTLVSTDLYFMDSTICNFSKMFAFGTNDFGSFPNENVEVRRCMILEVAHFWIDKLLSLSPLSSRLVIKQLHRNSPHHLVKSADQLSSFVENCLKIAHRHLSLRKDIFELLFDKLVQIDVLANRSDIQDAQSEMEAKKQHEMGHMDVDHVFDIESEGPSSSTVPEAPEEDTEITHHVLGHKLDLCLEKLLSYIRECSFDNSTGTLNAEASKELYTLLLSVFEKAILPVYDCHHTQFLLFYVCNFDKEFCLHFLKRMWNLFLNPSTIQSIKTTSACYMASLMARSIIVDVKLCMVVLNSWCSFLHQYIDRQDSVNEFDPVSHTSFYALCQAVFYLTAFRHREMLKTPNGHDFLLKLNLERIVKCHLNPLRACLSTVVSNFAAIARNYQLAYCYTVIERNRRLRLQETQSKTKVTKLESFFPFDPYVLRKTVKFIKPVYREYQSHSHDEDDITDEACEHEFTSHSLEKGNSLRDFLSYSTSPGFRSG